MNVLKAGLFYRVTRTIFGVSKATQPYFDTINSTPANPFRQTKAYAGIIDELTKIANRQNKLVAWLTGTAKLIKQISEQLHSAEHKLEVWLHPGLQNNQKEELKNLSGTIAASRGTYAILNEHLEKRQVFIRQAPKRSFMTIPTSFEKFGRNNQIEANSFISGNQPANYKNLKFVCERNIACKKSNQPTLARYHDQRQYTSANDIWTRASDAVDGAISAHNYAKRGLKWLKNSAAKIVIDAKGKPSWSETDPKLGTQEQAMYSWRY